MTNIISAAAYAASKALAQHGRSIQRSHVTEVLAAMLGYQTYAALTVEERDENLEYSLDDAEMLVLNLASAEQRAKVIGVSFASELIQACVLAMRNVTTIPVYEDLPQFYDDYAREQLIDVILSSDDVSAAMSETNSSFDSYPELPEEVPESDDLWAARVEWVIEAGGILCGSHDMESDRMFAGDTLNCYGKLRFNKAGRAGLILLDAEGGAGVEDSWRENDRDEELAYMARSTAAGM